MMNRLLILVAALAVSFAAQAQKPIVYPAKGQSQQQQQKDDGECYSWAKSNTCIDPAQASAPPPQQTGPAVGGGERVRGAARGAVGGAVVGEIAGDNDDDRRDAARAGAAIGTVRGGRQARQNQAAANQNAQAQQQGAMNTYYRAYGACMEGRGYSIK